MAKLLILSALLSAIFFPGAAYWTGSTIPVTSLQRFCSSSRDHWSGRMRDVAEGLSVPNMPGGLLSCRIDVMTCTSVRVDLVHTVGLDVSVFLDSSLRCKLAGLDVRLLLRLVVKVQLRVNVQALAVAACAVVDVKVHLPLLPLSIHASAIVNIITPILSDPCCVRARKVCHELNYIYDFDDDGPFPFPTNCTTVFQRHKPRITSQELGFPCSTLVRCGRTEYPFPANPINFLPSVITSTGVTFDLSAVQLNAILTLCRSRNLLDAIITLSSVTTSTIAVHVSQITVPGNHICMIRIKCLQVNVVLTANGAILRLTFQLDVGYQDSASFVVVLRLTLKIAVRLHLRIDCSRRLILLSVGDIRDWEISGSCPGKPCTIRYSELVVALKLRLEILRTINVALGIGIPWPIFRAYSCDSCSEAVCTKDGFYWPCTMRYPVF